MIHWGAGETLELLNFSSAWIYFTCKYAYFVTYASCLLLELHNYTNALPSGLWGPLWPLTLLLVPSFPQPQIASFFFFCYSWKAAELPALALVVPSAREVFPQRSTFFSWHFIILKALLRRPFPVSPTWNTHFHAAAAARLAACTLLTCLGLLYFFFFLSTYYFWINSMMYVFSPLVIVCFPCRMWSPQGQDFLLCSQKFLMLIRTVLVQYIFVEWIKHLIQSRLNRFPLMSEYII